MGFKYSEGFRTLQAGDLDGAVALYGHRDSATAAVLPQRSTAQPAELGLR
jgi:hypothetical protein